MVYYVCIDILKAKNKGVPITSLQTKKANSAEQLNAGDSKVQDTRTMLIRSGLAHLTESGFASSGLDKILKKVGVPKGSFYYYFSSKEAFGLAVLESYADYFANKLDISLLNQTVSPLSRLALFVEDAKQGMKRHQFKRGCLVGNLGQEVDLLPESFREPLIDTLNNWQSKVSACLSEAKRAGELAECADCEALAEFFWIGWEGAVSRAKLEASTRPLDNYLKLFLAGLPR